MKPSERIKQIKSEADKQFKKDHDFPVPEMAIWDAIIQYLDEENKKA